MAPIATLLLLLSVQPATASPAWMVGDWRCEAKPGEHVDEYWIGDGRGGLVGVGRTHGAGTKAIEFMRVTRGVDGRWTLHASPRGADPTPFGEVNSGASEIVFENASHDFPQRVSYRRDGEALIGTISKRDGSSSQSWRYARRAGANGRWPPCR